LSAVLDSDLDDLVAGEISSDGGILASLANDVGFVGLCYQIVSANDSKMAGWWGQISYSVGAC
jgi:hypothetical protein